MHSARDSLIPDSSTSGPMGGGRDDDDLCMLNLFGDINPGRPSSLPSTSASLLSFPFHVSGGENEGRQTACLLMSSYLCCCGVGGRSPRRLIRSLHRSSSCLDSFCLGGGRPHGQHRVDGWGGEIDLGDGRLFAEFAELVYELLNIICKDDGSRRAHVI